MKNCELLIAPVEHIGNEEEGLFYDHFVTKTEKLNAIVERCALILEDNPSINSIEHEYNLDADEGFVETTANENLSLMTVDGAWHCDSVNISLSGKSTAATFVYNSLNSDDSLQARFFL